MSLLEVRVREPKVMGWLGGWEGLPDRDLRRDQNLEGFRWRLRDWTLLIQVSREWLAMAEEISTLRSEREGCCGSEARARSRSRTSGMAAGGRLGMKSFLLPRGMWLAAAESRVLRKKASPSEQEEGGGSGLKGLLHLGSEGLPVRPTEVGVGAVRGSRGRVKGGEREGNREVVRVEAG